MGWWEVWIQRFHPRRSSTEEAPKGVIDLAAVSFAALLSVFFAHESFSYRSGERSSGRRDGAARNARRTHRLVRPQTSLFLQNVGSSDLEGKEGRGGRGLKEGGGLQWSCISRRRQRLDGSAPAISHWDCGLFHVVVWQTNDTTAQVACQLHLFPDVPNFFFVLFVS